MEYELEMKKIAILLMIITIFSKIFGFARDIILAYFYGASNISDAYLISLTIPIAIFSFIGRGISTGYIPMYSKIEQQYGEKEGNRYTNNLINILMCTCTIIVLFGLLFTGEIVKLFASGFEGDTLELAVRFTRISLIGIYFTMLVYIFSGFLQIKGNYAITVLVGFPLNIITIISVIISHKTNILVLSIGSVVAIASQLALLIPVMHKRGYRYKFVLDIKDENIKKMVMIALPIIVGASINEINVLVDRTLASSIIVGGISALNYANQLNGFVQGLFVTSISTVMYPIVSKMAVENNIDGLKKSVSEAMNVIELLVIPITIGAMVFAEQIIKLLFGRGAFDPVAISMTSTALFYYSIGMVGFGLRNTLSRAFYSLQDTMTPMVNAVISLILNIILNLILSKYMGIGGLALATSISSIFCTGLLFISFRKKVGPFGMRNITISFVKIVAVSAIMGAVAKLVFFILSTYTNQNLSLVLSVGTGALIYFVIISFMRIEEVDMLISGIKRKMLSVRYK